MPSGMPGCGKSVAIDTTTLELHDLGEENFLNRNQ